jgi:small-conductance mechanosensitive channel
MGIAVADENVCEDPEPRVRMRQFGASSLDFELLCWINQPVLRGRVLDALNCQVYKRFIEEDIEIPYSKQDLYIKELPK